MINKLIYTVIILLFISCSNNQYNATNLNNIKIKYPSLLTLTQTSNKIHLTHKLSKTFEDVCDRSGDNSLFDTDLDISIEIQNKTFQQIINTKYKFFANQMINDKKEIQAIPGFLEPYKIDKKNGYKISSSSHGCGTITYYFPIENSKTLIITEQLDDNYRIYKKELEKLPNRITPTQKEEILKDILTNIHY